MSSQTITKTQCNFEGNLRPVSLNQTGGNLGENLDHDCWVIAIIAFFAALRASTDRWMDTTKHIISTRSIDIRHFFILVLANSVYAKPCY